MGKQTQDAVSCHTDTLKLFRQGVLSSAADLGAIASTIESQHLFGLSEVCSDTTDGRQRAVDGQILRELWRQVRKRRKREQTSSTDCKGSKVGCCLFLSVNP